MLNDCDIIVLNFYLVPNFNEGISSIAPLITVMFISWKYSVEL